MVAVKGLGVDGKVGICMSPSSLSAPVRGVRIPGHLSSADV